MDGLLKFILLSMACILLLSGAVVILGLFHLQEEIDSILVLIFVWNINVTSYLAANVWLEVAVLVQEVSSANHLSWLLASLLVVLPGCCLQLE